MSRGRCKRRTSIPRAFIQCSRQQKVWAGSETTQRPSDQQRAKCLTLSNSVTQGYLRAPFLCEYNSHYVLTLKDALFRTAEQVAAASRIANRAEISRRLPSYVRAWHSGVCRNKSRSHWPASSGSSGMQRNSSNPWMKDQLNKPDTSM
jgi:hypothetical protein